MPLRASVTVLGVILPQIAVVAHLAVSIFLIVDSLWHMRPRAPPSRDEVSAGG